MEKTYNYDIDEFHFELFIGDNEGVLQPIKLWINGHIVIDNNWGIQHNLEYILGESKSDSGMQNDYDSNSTIHFAVHGVYLRIETSSMDFDYIAIRKEKHKEFITWIKSCLSPRQERIQIKINQLLYNNKLS